MLAYRLVFGTMMIAGSLGLFFLDDRMDQIRLTGFWQQVFLGRAYLPAGLPLLAVLIVLILLAARELANIFRAKHVATDTFMLSISGIVGCVLMYLIPYTLDSQITLAVYGSFMGGLFVLSMVRSSWVYKRTDGALAAASATMLALVYLGTLPGFFLAIRRWHSAWIILAIILVTKGCDIGAYFTGRWLGRRKLIHWLSPKKTWEGLVGGVVFSGLVCFAAIEIAEHLGVIGRQVHIDGHRTFVPYDLPLWFSLLSGMLLGIVGQFGDLTASLFKRDAGIKDSGGSIPGFGGVLDVVDSPLFVAPVAYWLMQIAWQLR